MKRVLFALAGLAAAVQIAAQNPRPEVVAQGLDRPWAFAFLPGGEFLVSEKPGAMRIVSAQGTIGAPLTCVPKAEFVGQGGLLDVVLDSGFASNRTLCLLYTSRCV